MKKISDEFPHAAQHLQRLEAELASEEAEKLRRQDEENERLRIVTEDQGFAQAAAVVEGLRPLFEKRAALAQTLAPILAEFWRVIAEQREREGVASGILAKTRRHRNTPEPFESLRRLEREAIGVTDRYSPELPEPRDQAELFVSTIIWAVYSGYLRPGRIELPGGHSISVNFRR